MQKWLQSQVSRRREIAKQAMLETGCSETEARYVAVRVDSRTNATIREALLAVRAVAAMFREPIR